MKSEEDPRQVCRPVSFGMPNWATQVQRNASVQEAAEIPLRGEASSHLVVLSMMVRM
jgi:hypothetical protein